MTSPTSDPRSVRALGALFVVVLMLATSAPTVAGPSDHTGRRGVHVLIDNNEYPGQICHYDTSAPGALRRIAVRRPVIFAPDLTSGRDQRWVGWRFRLQRSTDGSTWSTFYTSGFRKALAHDDQPAPLEPRGRDVTGDDSHAYRALVDLAWYTATSASATTGQATHAPRFSLAVMGSFESTLNNTCPGAIFNAAAAEPAGASHADDVGLHTMIDDPQEFPGVTCVYSETGRLVSIKVRAPVVFAQDDRVGAQQVRWRFSVRAGDGPPDPIVHTSSWTEASATETTAARWRARSVRVDGREADLWVVGVRIEWLGAGTPRPFAIHGAYHRTGPNVFGYCFGSNR